jgi:AI-2 transport protein TqsA
MTEPETNQNKRRIHLTVQDEQVWLAVGSLMVLAAVALAAALAYTAAVMIPFVLAVFTVAVVSPIVDYQVVRWQMPRILAISTTLLLVLAIFAVLGLLMVLSVQIMLETAGQYSDSFTRLTADFLAQLDKWNIAIDEKRVVHDLQGRLPGVLTQTLGSVTGLLSNGTLILIFVVFLLAGRSTYAGPTGVYAEIESTVRGYVATKFGISAVTGILVWAILWLMGLQMSLLFGMFAFLLNFIPSLGSIVATLLPIPVAVAQFDSPFWIVAVIAIPGAVQIVTGNAIEPKLMGQGMELHPVTVMLALTFWGLLWGMVGMVLAVPITATIRIVLMQFSTTRPIALLLAGHLPHGAADTS